jgi:ABC-type transport system involved in cytochrome c biogenesis permease subunit
LVPVLKSVWLVIHVAIITASYAFLGLGALLALVNLVLMIFKTKDNYKYIDANIQKLSGIIEMALVAGLYMLTIGTFLGGVWANESWGRYWGWDPKEAWALITIILYAFVAHLRLIPGLKGFYTFNLFGLFSFASVIMTYFGVNYYLAGLHSYAKGDPLPVPGFVIYTVVSLIVIAGIAFVNHNRISKKAYGMRI